MLASLLLKKIMLKKRNCAVLAVFFAPKYLENTFFLLVLKKKLQYCLRNSFFY